VARGATGLVRGSTGVVFCSPSVVFGSAGAGSAVAADLSVVVGTSTGSVDNLTLEGSMAAGVAGSKGGGSVGFLTEFIFADDSAGPFSVGDDELVPCPAEIWADTNCSAISCNDTAQAALITKPARISFRFLLRITLASHYARIFQLKLVTRGIAA
jgi:hypothetical protein